MTGARLSLILLLLAPLHAFADDLPTLATDSRVRITAPTLLSRPLIGDIAGILPDTLVLAPRTHIPISAIARFEVSLGQRPLGQSVRNHAWKGAFVLAGIVAAGAVQEYRRGDHPNGNTVLFAVLCGAGAGGVLGGVYGAVYRPERWAALPPAHLRRYAPPNYSTP